MSGSLSRGEVEDLYRTTMGERLKKKQLDEAMKTMDTDGSGQVVRRFPAVSRPPCLLPDPCSVCILAD